MQFALPNDFHQRFLDAKLSNVSSSEINHEGVRFDNELHVDVGVVVPPSLRGLVLLKNKFQHEYIFALNDELLSQHKVEVAKRKNALAKVSECIWGTIRPLLTHCFENEVQHLAITNDWKIVILKNMLAVENELQEAEIREFEFSESQFATA